VVVARQMLAVGATITAPAIPAKEATAQYTFTFKGWSTDGVNVATLGTMGEENITFYALFNATVIEYIIRFLNGDKVLQTSRFAYGAIPTFTGTNPTSEGMDFGGWTPEITPVTGHMDYYAKFVAPSAARQIINRTISGEYYNPMIVEIPYNAFCGCSKLESVYLPNATKYGQSIFGYGTQAKSIRLPAMPPVINVYTFDDISSSFVFYIPTGSLSAYQLDTEWNKLITKYSFVEEDR
jgi:hypothetical protein